MESAVKKKIGVMIGSISDLPQCREGIEYLLQAELAGKIQFLGLFVNSIHRNTVKVLENLHTHTQVIEVDRWIVGAGMANHLTGTCDAFLRYGLKSTAPVFGAIFEASKDVEKNRQAAILSITQVPGTQVVFDSENPTFLKACEQAVEIEEVLIEVSQPKPTEAFFSLQEVLERIEAA